MTIGSKNRIPEEEEVAGIIRNLVREYDVPEITSQIIVEQNTIPHSHPVLTMNTRTRDPLVILKTLVHEQLHWWTQGKSTYDACIAFLKNEYVDNGECNKSGKYPDSFWEHIIVCFNTRKILNGLVSEEEVEHIYSQWQPYPKTEKLIEETYKKIESVLLEFNMVYTK